MTRQAGHNPVAILEIQHGIIQFLMQFQEKKVEFRKDGNELGEAITKRLILLLNRMMDALV